MFRVKEVEGSLSHLQNMPLKFLNLFKLSKVERSLSHIQNIQLAYLNLYSLSKVEGIMTDKIELFIEGLMQGLFMIIEATVMHAQLEKMDYRTGDDGLKAIMETKEYQLNVSRRR